MAEAIKNVVLVGASGNMGPYIIEEFLKSSFHLTVFSRADSKSTFPEGVTVRKTDYSPASLEQGFKGQDAVISILGSAGFQEQPKLVDAAIKAGVKRFIPSEFGINTADERILKIVPPFAAKKNMADYLKSKEGEGISWTGVITGPIFDWGLKTGFLGFDSKKQSVQIWDGGKAHVSQTNVGQIGRALVAILSPEHLAETKNTYVYIHSHTLTQHETLAAIERVSGKKWTVSEEVSTKDVIPPNLEKVKNGDYSAVRPLLLSAVYNEGGFTDSRKIPGGLWNDRLGLPKEDLDADIKRALAG